MKNVTMVLCDFPVVSQTFINIQIAELINRGFNIQIANLGKRFDCKFANGVLSSVVDNINIVSVPYYGTSSKILKFLLLLYMVVSNTVSKPLSALKLFLDLFGRLTIFDFKLIHADAYLFRKLARTDVVHCQFFNLADRVSKLLVYGFIAKEETFFVSSVRGKDITDKETLRGMNVSEIFNTFDLFLPVCDYFKKRLEEMNCNKRIMIVGSPIITVIEDLKYSKNKSDDTADIISVGRFEEKKGFGDALEAMRIVKERKYKFRYKIIGDGSLYNVIKSKISQYGLDDVVELTGKLPGDRTLEEIAKSDIMIVPSKTASGGDSEGIPNVLKEGLMFGLQVVATRHSGIPEIVDDDFNGILVSESSPSEIAEAVEYLLNNRNTWSTRSFNARRSIADKYSVNTITDELLKAYSSLSN